MKHAGIMRSRCVFVQTVAETVEVHCRFSQTVGNNIKDEELIFFNRDSDSLRENTIVSHGLYNGLRKFTSRLLTFAEHAACTKWFLPERYPYKGKRNDEAVLP